MFKFTFKTIKESASNDGRLIGTESQLEQDRLHAKSDIDSATQTAKKIIKSRRLNQPYAIFSGDLNYHPFSRRTEKPEFVIAHSSLPGTSGVDDKGVPLAAATRLDLERSPDYFQIHIPAHRYSMHGAIAELAPEGMTAFIHRDTWNSANRSDASIFRLINQQTLSKALSTVVGRKPSLANSIGVRSGEAEIAAGQGLSHFRQFFTDAPSVDAFKHDDNHDFHNIVDQSVGSSIVMKHSDGVERPITARAILEQLPVFNRFFSNKENAGVPMVMTRIARMPIAVQARDNGLLVRNEKKLQRDVLRQPGGRQIEETEVPCGGCSFPGSRRGNGKRNRRQRDNVRINRLSMFGASTYKTDPDPVTGGLIIKRIKRSTGSDLGVEQVTPPNVCKVCNGIGLVKKSGRTERAKIRTTITNFIGNPVYIVHHKIDSSTHYLPQCDSDCSICHGDTEWQGRNGEVCPNLITHPSDTRGSLPGIQYLQKDGSIQLPAADLVSALREYHESMGGQEDNPHVFSPLERAFTSDPERLLFPNKNIIDEQTTGENRAVRDPKRDPGLYIDVIQNNVVNNAGNLALPRSKRSVTRTSPLSAKELSTVFGTIGPGVSMTDEQDYADYVDRVKEIRAGRNYGTIGSAQERQATMDFILKRIGRLPVNQAKPLPVSGASTVRKKVIDPSRELTGVTDSSFVDVPTGKNSIVVPESWQAILPHTWKTDEEIGREPDSVDVHIHPSLLPSVNEVQGTMHDVIGDERTGKYQSALDKLYITRTHIEQAKEEGIDPTFLHDRLEKHYNDFMQQLSESETPESVEQVKKSLSGLVPSSPNVEGGNNEKA